MPELIFTSEPSPTGGPVLTAKGEGFQAIIRRDSGGVPGRTMLYIGCGEPGDYLDYRIVCDDAARASKRAAFLGPWLARVHRDLKTVTVDSPSPFPAATRADVEQLAKTPAPVFRVKPIKKKVKDGN